MTDVWLFIIAGAIAVAAAVMMLLSENAVHAALFLIVTMLSIAFLFLMLNSPFLAMIQITVYAGAIMVLFIFVIMLLGAEQLKSADPGEPKRRFRWFTPVALALALALLFTVGLATIQGNIDANPAPLPNPLVRAVNTANSGAIDVYVGSVLVAEDVAFANESDFAELPAGEYVISVRPSGGGEVTQTVTLRDGEVVNILAYGTEVMPLVAIVPQDLAPVVNPTETRITLFNGLATGSITVAELFSYDAANDAYFNIVASDVAPSSSTEFVEPSGVANWVFLSGGTSPEFEFAQLASTTLSPEHSNLIVVATEIITDVNAMRTAPLMFATAAEPMYGSPRSIGFALFTTFLLPFQVLALLLLAAMVGVIVLAHRELKPIRKIQQRRKVSRPLTDVITSQVGADVMTDLPQLPQPTPEPSPSGD
jgi:NADH-quinone oxidoreductase subunit J